MSGGKIRERAIKIMGERVGVMMYSIQYMSGGNSRERAIWGRGLRKLFFCISE